MTAQELINLYLENNKTWFLHYPENVKNVTLVYVGRGTKIHIDYGNNTSCGAGTSQQMHRRPSYKTEVRESEFLNSQVCSKCVSVPMNNEAK
jgi:hypothetical protein